MQATEKAHSLLAPSSMDRIIDCPASLAESDGMPNTGNKYTWEGTAAHELHEDCLLNAIPAIAYLGREIAVIEKNKEVACFEVDEEMAGNVQLSLDKVYEYMSLAEDAELFVEAKVDYSDYVNYPDSGGTSDVIILIPSMRLLIIVDFKYGRGVEVDAEGNAQMMSYALGALEEYKYAYDIGTVTMAIHQPRTNNFSEDTISVDMLYEWAAERMVPGCQQGIYLLEMKRTGAHIGTDFYNPTPDNCKFCKGKTKCIPAQEYVEEAIECDFEDLDATVPELDDKPPRIEPPDDDARLNDLYPKLDMIYDWVSAVLARIESRLLSGAKYSNAKLVRGRKGHTKWADEEQAETDLKAMRLKQEEIYNMKLISPTQAKAKFKDNPKRLKKLLSNTTQSEGKISVAPITDERDEWVPDEVEFNDLDAQGADDLA